MIVIICRNAPGAVRGTLSLYLLQLDPGIYVGHIDKNTEKFLEEFIIEKKEKDFYGVILKQNKKNQQGYDFSFFGIHKNRKKVKFDSVDLIGVFEKENEDNFEKFL